MRPDVWGKSLWQTMHAIALGYPADVSEYQKLAYRSFFAMLGEVIPCDTCAASYRRLLHKRGGLATLDAALDGSKACKSSTSPLFDWTVAVHNAVNRELEKSSSDWTPDRARIAVLRGGTEGAQAPSCAQASGGRVISATWKAMAVGFIFAFAFLALCLAAFLWGRECLAQARSFAPISFPSLG